MSRGASMVLTMTPFSERKVAQFWASVVLPTPGAPAIRMPDRPPASRSVRPSVPA